MWDSKHAKTMNNYIDKQYEENMNRQRDFEAFESEYKRLYEQQKQRADQLELQLKKTTEVAIARLDIISNFKTFLCESIDNAKEDCKKDDCISNRLWLKAMQYVYTYGIKNFKENEQ